MMNCKDCRSHLPDLLLDADFAAAQPGLQTHLANCTECSAELAELRATFALLDAWEAPEPSPFFDSRLQARLREAAEAEPEGFWERTRSFLLYSTGRQLRPALAGSLALVLVLSGGTFVGLRQQSVTVPVATSATVNDLKILDNNAQALQQMDQLLDDSASGNDDGATPPTS